MRWIKARPLSVLVAGLLVAWVPGQARALDDGAARCPATLPSAGSDFWVPPKLGVPKDVGSGQVVFKPLSYTRLGVGIGSASYDPNNGRSGFTDSNWYWVNAGTIWDCLGNSTAYLIIIDHALGHAEKYFGDDDQDPDQNVGTTEDGDNHSDLTGGVSITPGSPPPSGSACVEFYDWWVDGGGYHENVTAEWCFAI